MKTLSIAAIILSFVVCGCIQSVTTSPYRKNESNSGVVYSLPKTRLQVTVTYTIRSTTNRENGVPTQNTKEVIIAKPVVIQPLLVSDPNNIFVLSGENLVKDARLDASFKFQVYENQLLAGVTSEAQDKSPEILQGLVSTGISIAKMIAMAGEKKPALLENIGERLKQINNQLVSLVLPKSQDKRKAELDQIDKLLKEQAKLIDIAKKYIENNSDQIEVKDISHTQILDITNVKDFKRVNECLVAEVRAQKDLLGVPESEIPVTKIELLVSEEQVNNANNKFFKDDHIPPENGVIYRVPTLIRVKVTVAPNNILVFDDEIPFVQVGPFNKVEAKYKMLADRKTQITFSPTSGSIKEYGVEATSSAEAVAKALDTSLSKVQTAVTDIKKNQDAIEAAKKTTEQKILDELGMRKKLLEAESDLIKAQQELDKLKSGSGSN